MKNLFYKEMKLAMHPVIWVFIILFPLMVLIPSYPSFISFIYICSSYPILFLGANKGQQSNDIYYTCLLPIKKSDAVKARMLTVLFIQAIAIVLFAAFSPLAMVLQEQANQAALASGGEMVTVGLTAKAFGSSLAFVIVGLALYDLLYISLFYKTARSIVLQTFLGIIGFMIFCGITIVVLPMTNTSYNAFFEKPLVQAISVGIALLFSALMHILTFKIAKNNLDKVDL